MTPVPGRDLSKHRPNVGLVLFHRDGRVWLGKRAGAEAPYNWQFPQGGVDANETFDDAALRELHEETGVRTVRFLAATKDWIAYDFPPDVLATGRGRGFLGQKQIWYAFRFEGQDCEIDLNVHDEVEFDDWRWANLAEVIDKIAPFKRDAYRQVIATFAEFAKT